MAKREEAKIVQIEALLERIMKRIGRDGGRAKWLTSPATVGPMPFMSALSADLPALYLEVPEVTKETALTAGLHESEAIVSVLMISRNPDEPGRELHRLRSDLVRALGEAEGEIYALADGGIWPNGYSYDAERSERLGAACGRALFLISYKWIHENP